ncbi:unnamed protein product, partial [Rhizoctonia solani]
MTISQDSGMIETDDGDRPQLVHYRDYIEKPSRLVRLAIRVGLSKGIVANKCHLELIERCVENKPLMVAVELAYSFLSRNFRQGDQVTLFVYSNQHHYLDAAEMLAKHLHDGTRPGHLSGVQYKHGEAVSPGRIPIHCVAVWGLGEKASISEWNDELKSRFPAGIDHIICVDYRSKFQSCATRYDADGGMISREMCISRGDSYGELRRHCTKHVIYFKEDKNSEWGSHEPVWTHKLDSSPSDVQGGLPLEATKPFG